ncbi:MAG: hypothetical protein ACR2JB_21090 [Bryobacteraceae bacterium]
MEAPGVLDGTQRHRQHQLTPQGNRCFAIDNNAFNLVATGVLEAL